MCLYIAAFKYANESTTTLLFNKAKLLTYKFKFAHAYVYLYACTFMHTRTQLYVGYFKANA